MAALPPVELPGSYSSPPASPLRSPLASPPNSPPSSAPVAPGHQPQAMTTMTCSQRMEAQDREWRREFEESEEREAAQANRVGFGCTRRAANVGRGALAERQLPGSSEPVAVPWPAVAADEDSEWRRAVELHLAQLGEPQHQAAS